MKGTEESAWAKKGSIKGANKTSTVGNNQSVIMKRRIMFRAPNVRFSIRRAYKNFKKRFPSFKEQTNLLTWRNLFFLSSTVKIYFKEIEEKQRHHILSFIFYRNLIRL